MTLQPAPSKDAFWRGSSIAVALVLGIWSIPTFASTGVDTDCRQPDETLAAADLAPPSLTISAAEHSVSSSAAIERDIADMPVKSEAQVLPHLSSGTNAGLQEVFGEGDDQDTAITDETELTPSDSPPAATRLPGVAEEDLPRFRRQMFRTDI